MTLIKNLQKRIRQYHWWVNKAINFLEEKLWSNVWEIFYCPYCESNGSQSFDDPINHLPNCFWLQGKKLCEDLQYYQPKKPFPKPPKIYKNPKQNLENTYEKRNEILKILGYTDYEAYLESDLWKSIRIVVLKQFNFRCRVCDGKTTIIHHLSYDYDTLVGRDLTKLVLLCKGCHKLIEFDENGMKRSIKNANRFLCKLLSNRGKSL